MIDQGNLITRKMCLLFKGETSRSHEIDEKGFHGELCSSDRSGQPDNPSENIQVKQIHDRSGQPDEVNSSSAHTVKEQHAPEVRREIALLNTDNEFNREINEEDIDFNIPDYRIQQWCNCMAPAFENWFRKSRTTPHRHALQRDLQQSQSLNPFSQESKEMIREVENVELCELLDMEPKAQCKVCLSYWDVGIVYCTCGHFLRNGTEENRKFVQYTMDLLSIPNYYVKKGRPHGHRYGKKPGDFEHFVANQLKKKCKKKNFLGIHDRFTRDEKFRKNMFDVGRSEELCREMDKLANEDHTHHITAEEISVYRNNWWLRSNTVGSDAMPVRHRADFKQVLSTLRQLKHQQDTVHQQRWKSYSHLGGTGKSHHEDGPSTDWSGKPVEKWLGYLFEVWFSEFTWCIITVQNSVTANAVYCPRRSKHFTSNTVKSYAKWLRRKPKLRWKLWEQVCDELQHHHKQQLERHAQQAAHNAQNKYTNDDVDFDDCVVHIMRSVCT